MLIFHDLSRKSEYPTVAALGYQLFMSWVAASTDPAPAGGGSQSAS